MSCKTMDFGKMKKKSKKSSHLVPPFVLLAASSPSMTSCDRLPSSGKIWTDLTDMREKVSTWWNQVAKRVQMCDESKTQRQSSYLHKLLFTQRTAKFRGCHESKQKKELSVWFVYLMSLTEQIQSTSRWEPYVPSWKDHNACTHSHMGLRQAQLISWRHIPSKAKGVAFLCKQKSKSNFYKRRRRKIQSLVGPVSRC